jgi:hypothetical protein
VAALLVLGVIGLWWLWPTADKHTAPVVIEQIATPVTPVVIAAAPVIPLEPVPPVVVVAPVPASVVTPPPVTVTPPVPVVEVAVTPIATPPVTAPVAPATPASAPLIPATVAAATMTAPLLGDPLPNSEPRLVSRIPASLSVSSIPTGAAIYLDGQQMGTTPALLRNLTAGAHDLRLVKPGHLDVVGTVMLPSGQVTRISNPLPKPASLELLRIPVGAQVEVAGLAYAAGMTLPSGMIELTLTRNGEERRYRLTLHPSANVYQVEP